MKPHRLITIGVSHYCEKARWALDRLGVAYTEDAHAPVWHALVARLNGGGQTVPVLKTAEGQTFADSTDILRFLDSDADDAHKLYPSACAEEVAALEERFDEALGPAARRLVYGEILYDPSFAKTLGRGVRFPERACFRATVPLVRLAMKRAMNLSPKGVERSRVKADEVFAEVAQLLETRRAEGHETLAGAGFTAADLSFAALAAPLVMPPEYGFPLPSLESLAPSSRALIEDYRSRPAGAFALKVYREYRQQRVGAN